MSCVTCHLSCVTCYFFLLFYFILFGQSVSPVIFLFIYLIFIFFGQSGGASLWRVCYQRGLPCLVFMCTAAKTGFYIKRKKFMFTWYLVGPVLSKVLKLHLWPTNLVVQSIYIKLQICIDFFYIPPPPPKKKYI